MAGTPPGNTSPKLDFYDMKGRLELLLSGLRLTNVTYTEASSAQHLHPGKAAEVKVNGQVVGVFGELHPLVKEGYVLGDAPVLEAISAREPSLIQGKKRKK